MQAEVPANQNAHHRIDIHPAREEFVGHSGGIGILCIYLILELFSCAMSTPYMCYSTIHCISQQ